MSDEPTTLATTEPSPEFKLGASEVGKDALSKQGVFVFGAIVLIVAVVYLLLTAMYGRKK